MTDGNDTVYNEYYARNDDNTGRPITKSRDNPWIPAVFLVALFFFVGLGLWNLTYYRTNVTNPTGETEFGIGGAPGELISPLPDPTATPIPTIHSPIGITGATGTVNVP